MKVTLARLVTAFLAVASALLGMVLVASPAQAATQPPWEPDPSAVGTISFYDANGTQVYGGSSSGTAPFAKYAVGSAYPRSGDKFAELQFANPQKGVDPTDWFVEDATGGTTLPYTGGPASIAALGASKPVSVGSVDDQTLDGFEGDSAIDQNDGYKNVIQVRLRTANANGTPAQVYDSADIQVDPTNHTWTQIYPAPATDTTPGAPTNVSAVAGDRRALVSWTAPASSGGTAITDYVVQYSTDGTTFTTATDGTSTATTATVSNLTNGQRYFFRVAAVNSAGQGPYSGVSAAIVPQAAGTFTPLSPARVLDTRTSTAVGANATRELAILGQGGVPSSNVSAVVLNVTVTKPTKGGYLTVYGSGNKPTASNLNFVAGQTVPNLVVAPVGTDGKVRFFNGSPGTVQVIADVSGYYRGGTPSVAGAFASVTPSRVLDTRTSSAVGANGTRELSILGQGGVPSSNVSAVVLNVTVTKPTKSGYLTVYGSGNKPTASNLNLLAGQTVPNLVIAPVGSDGKVRFFNGSAGTTQVIADVSGYFIAGQATEPGAFVSLTPARLVDTRKTTPVSNLGPNATLHLQVAGNGGVPTTGVSAVQLNVTVAAPTAGGYVTVYGDTTTPRPTTSNVNFSKGQVVPNAVVSPIGTNGKVAFYNGSTGTTPLIADVSGYYLAAT